MKKSILISVLLIVMLFFVGCSKSSSGSSGLLLGEWQVVSHEYDMDVVKSNSMNEMRADIFAEIFAEGSFIIISENTLDMASFGVQGEYKVEENKIFTKDATTGNWSPDYVTFSIEDSNNMKWYTSGVTFNLVKQ